MRAKFPLFSNPINLAHMMWTQILNAHDTVIDATLGNGKDTLFVAQSIQKLGGGKIIGIDIQLEAIASATDLLTNHFTTFPHNIKFYHTSHENFPQEIPLGSVKLIIYNLGYLPGFDKSITTQTSTTQTSIQHALAFICPGGCISITCYIGHEEGDKEYKALQPFLQKLPPQEYCFTEHTFNNRNHSPILLLIQKKVN
jgi:threonine dehydrogenase-like Zn-dependent dehydrogenase